MSLAPKTRLGPYEVVSPIGSGGMGEVYLARDTELDREVAIKALHEAVEGDPERVARFQREARVLASIKDHPNIGSIYAVERRDSRLYLVLELVEGDTLAERLRESPMGVREVLTIFLQIANALEAAHAKNVVHRDLKPDNIKITPAGLVKVLDFGLAKPFEEPVPSDDGKTKTAPPHMTVEGQIMGTPTYMSPEQTWGQTLDKGTDIWSFGVCLYEALSGRLPFRGKNFVEVRKSIHDDSPNFAVLPRRKAIRKLLRRCLEKDPKRRLHDIGDARIEIEDLLENADLEQDEDDRPPLSKLALAVAIVASLFAGWVIGRNSETDVESRSLKRFAIDLPPEAPIALGSGPALAIASDGGRFAYTSRRGGTTELRLRAMDRLEPTALPETAGATNPFFAPDADVIGFFAGGKLMSHPLVGPPRAIADARSPRGGSFGPDGGIVFSPETVTGLQRVSSSTLRADVITTPNVENDERSHRWPSHLPDGQSVLFTNWSGESFDIEWVSLASGEHQLLVENGSYPRYVPTGHVLFVRDGTLWGVAVDPSRLDRVGEPARVLDDVHMDPLTGAAFYDVSREGTLVYVPRVEDTSGEPSSQLLEVTRAGAIVRVVLPTPRSYQMPRISQNGRLMFTLTEDDRTDVYVSDLGRGMLSRVTFTGYNGAGIWTPDGTHATFSSGRDGEALNLYSVAVDGSGSVERLTESPNAQFPSSWSPDGSVLVYTEHNGEEFDVWLYRRGGRRVEPLLVRSFNDRDATISPNGKWLAYVSDETGEDVIYVSAFLEDKGRYPVSEAGAHEPVWSADGRELFYRGQGWLWSVDVTSAPDFPPPQRLFEAPFDEAGAPYANYDVMPENDRFIMVRTDDELSATRIIVVLDWLEELKRLVPVPR